MGSRSFKIILLLTMVFTSCKDHTREEQLGRWELSLKTREQQLALKEADYQSLLHMRDSLLEKKDTTVIKNWPVALQGLWKSTVLCKESRCNNYVIGDQRSETWDFQADSTGLCTRVLNDKKLIRIYTGQLAKQEIQLYFRTDSTAKKQVTMEVTLDEFKPDVIKGTQIITAENNCTAKFSVELTRPTPN